MSEKCIKVGLRVRHQTFDSYGVGKVTTILPHSKVQFLNELRFKVRWSDGKVRNHREQDLIEAKGKL